MEINKEYKFLKTHEYLTDLGIEIKTVDKERPWGGFFVIEDASSEKFVSTFFPTIPSEKFNVGKISPKILLVEPQKKLSWQYHNRRSEVWKLIDGAAGIVRSNDNEQTHIQQMKIDDIIELQQGERHRLVGLDEWGTIAEIWIHTDPKNPSNEDDIIRVSDDFGR
jgi:mannose-6-phosphate isomerase-like protein (cupin superfamily)